MFDNLSYLKGFPDFYDQGTPLCAETDPEAFFPQTNREDSTMRKVGIPTPQSGSQQIRSAKQICSGCPYKEPCLIWAIPHKEIGIWGGTTEMERRRIRGVVGQGRRGRPSK